MVSALPCSLRSIGKRIWLAAGWYSLLSSFIWLIAATISFTPKDGKAYARLSVFVNGFMMSLRKLAQYCHLKSGKGPHEESATTTLSRHRTGRRDSARREDRY